jgi:hypothetical protein
MSLKGTGFSPYVKVINRVAFSRRGIPRPQRLKPSFLQQFAYGLKPVPFIPREGPILSAASIVNT